MKGYKDFIEDNFDIVDKNSEIIPFKLNPIQNKYLLEDYSGYDAILKARQQGFSSLILGMFTIDFLLKENTRSVIVADISDNATELLDRVKFYIKSYEYHNKLKVPLKYNSKYELFNEAKNTRYTIGTSDNADFGRSKTINNLHLSEFAFYKHPERLFAGAMQAVVPSGRVIIETTANGFNFFKEFWKQCSTGERPFKPSFYPASAFYSKQFLVNKKKELGRFFKQEYPETPNEAFLQATGLVHTDFDVTKHIKKIDNFQAEYFIRGLDIGYRNPTAMPIIAVDKDDVWYQQYELYEAGLTTPRLIEEIKELNTKISVFDYDLSTADSAQAGDIAELNDAGEDFIPVTKQSGESQIDYVRWKIQKFAERLRANKYFLHPRCTNTVKEFQSYRWKPKPKVQSIDVNMPEQPEKANDHCFVGSTIIDTLDGAKSIKELVGTSGYLYTIDGIRKYTNVKKTRRKEPIIELQFSDGRKVKCTKDHLFLTPSGWTEAKDLKGKQIVDIRSTELIQSITNGFETINNLSRISRKTLLFLWEILPKKWREITQEKVARHLWKYSKGYAHSPQRRQSKKQQNREFGDGKPSKSLTEALDKRERRICKGKCCGERNAKSEKVAQVKTRKKVAQKAWERYLEKKGILQEELRTLSKGIRNPVSNKVKILLAKMCNKETARCEEIQKVGKADVYNLHVNGTRCYSIEGGIIVHNCMDALEDLNAMYMHYYEENKKKPWADKIPGTYIPPAVEELDEETSFTENRTDDYWDDVV